MKWCSLPRASSNTQFVNRVLLASSNLVTDPEPIVNTAVDIKALGRSCGAHACRAAADIDIGSHLLERGLLERAADAHANSENGYIGMYKIEIDV